MFVRYGEARAGSTGELSNVWRMAIGCGTRAYFRSRRTGKDLGLCEGFTELRRNGSTARDRRGLMLYERGDGRGDGPPGFCDPGAPGRVLWLAVVLTGRGPKSRAMGSPLLVHLQICRYER